MRCSCPSAAGSRKVCQCRDDRFSFKKYGFLSIASQAVVHQYCLCGARWWHLVARLKNYCNVPRISVPNINQPHVLPSSCDDIQCVEKWHVKTSIEIMIRALGLQGGDTGSTSGYKYIQRCTTGLPVFIHVYKLRARMFGFCGRRRYDVLQKAGTQVLTCDAFWCTRSLHPVIALASDNFSSVHRLTTSRDL